MRARLPFSNLNRHVNKRKVEQHSSSRKSLDWISLALAINRPSHALKISHITIALFFMLFQTFILINKFSDNLNAKQIRVVNKILLKQA